MPYLRRPPWLKLDSLSSSRMDGIRQLTNDLRLHTVCESSRCPNRPQCFESGTATFMLLGDVCTRNCTFCSVEHGLPGPIDASEPERILQAVEQLSLKYVVITSVTRDDLPDGGAGQFARTIQELHKPNPIITVEVLIPDFGGLAAPLEAVLDAAPNILNHNMETVPRLYTEVRPQAQYHRSLELLKRVRQYSDSIITKSGFMLGLGENKPEVLSLMEDLRRVSCDVLTIGQYLQPSLQHHEVVRYVTPQEFKEYETAGKDMGFAYVASAPLVRSSFHAEDIYRRISTEA